MISASFRTIFYAILFFLFLFMYSSIIHASVIINEVAIQPNQVVELYNTASTSADISSWYIDDAGGTTYFTVPQQTILNPQSCLLFSSDFNFNKSSSDVIRLFDNTSPPTSSSAKLIEQYSYAKAPDTSYSFSKKNDGGSEWQISVSSLGLFNESLLSCIPTPTPTLFPTPTPLPTPTAVISSLPREPSPLSSPTPESYYQNIYISEVYPYPYLGGEEWVELYNGNSTQVNLDHWYVDDIENGGSAPKSFTLIIDPYAYGVVTLTSPMFNNSGDVVRLLDGNKQEKDSMEYGKISQGKSIGRISFSDDYYCEQEPSKNNANARCIAEPTQETTTHLYAVINPPSKKTPTIEPKIDQITKRPNFSNNTLITPQKSLPGEVLAAQTTNIPSVSPAPYLSLVSFSYSLLTIVSVFIKMKYV